MHALFLYFFSYLRFSYDCANINLKSHLKPPPNRTVSEWPFSNSSVVINSGNNNNNYTNKEQYKNKN